MKILSIPSKIYMKTQTIFIHHIKNCEYFGKFFELLPSSDWVFKSQHFDRLVDRLRVARRISKIIDLNEMRYKEWMKWMKHMNYCEKNTTQISQQTTNFNVIIAHGLLWIYDSILFRLLCLLFHVWFYVFSKLYC